MRRALVSLILLVAWSTASVPGAVFQYAVPVQARKRQRTAYLWVPPQAKWIRGVVMAGMTLMEREFVQDSRIRKACAEEQLAIVFLKCGLGAADLQKVLDDLAKVSGYRELSVAPLLFVGHSAGGPQARDAARKMSGRCFGVVQYRGADPGGDNPVPPGIPALMMIGQFDEFGKLGRDRRGVENWEKDRDKMIAYRSKHKRNLGSLLVEPGAGHFAWSDRNARYLALFLGKAARARIPASWPIGAKSPVTLKAMDPTTGWLTDLTLKPAGRFQPAPYTKYKGDRAKAAWHFDEELARATVAYHAGLDRKDQFIQWKDRYRVDAGARFFFEQVQWVGDGQTFEVHPTYANTYPPQYRGRGPKWGKAGKPVGHSSAPIHIKKVGGPVVLAGRHRLRIRYDELAPATENGRVTFMAYSLGDKEFRYTERVGMLPRSAGRLTKGKPQTITFAPIGKVKANSNPIELKATSDAGLPVEFHVGYGPARIANRKLVIAEVPARLTYPIAVKVVAYQFGCGVKPFVQTAKPVERTIQVEGP